MVRLLTRHDIEEEEAFRSQPFSLIVTIADPEKRRRSHGDLGPNGQRGEQWRLMVRLLTRHDIEEEEAFRSQPFSLIVTIADPEKKAPVYDEMSRVVRNRFRAQNLTLRSAIRVRGRQ